MSPDSLPEIETTDKVAALYRKAEHAIKKVELTHGELVIPSVNQLRYAGCHLTRFLANPEDTDELDHAANHCKRSAYDAYEAGIVYNILEFKKFKED